MRKTIVFFTISLDGCFEGPNHDLTWHNVDDEFNKFAIEQLHETGLILFGRRTYQLMEGFWPDVELDPKSTKDDFEVAHLMNTIPKIVFSTTLKDVKESKVWKNIQLRNKLDINEIKKLKGMSGKDIWVGGSDLAVSLMEEDLIDEIRAMVNPLVLGKGRPLFDGTPKKVKLKLLKTRTFESGNVLLCYEPVLS